MLEQCVARGMNPLRMKQVCSVCYVYVMCCNLMYGVAGINGNSNCCLLFV